MHRIERFLKHLANVQWLEQVELERWTIEEVRYVTAGQYELLSPRKVSDRTLQSTHGITYMLETEITIPADWNDDPTALLFHAGGGEGLLNINGEHYHGLDKNHTFIPLRASHIGQSLQIEIELYDPIPEPHDPLNGQPEFVAPLSGFTSSIVRINAGLRSLMHSIRLLIDAAQRLPEGDRRRYEIREALEECMRTAYDLPQESWQLSEPWEQLQQLLRQRVGAYAPDAETNGRMIMVGQSHIDLAWLWPVRETVRKTSRTFSTMCTLLEHYPEFIYTQSQPQLFAYVKDHYPELYAKIKQYVAAGRWELVGGMWIEPDLNIPSGESLARQLLYGQRFYREEFQQTSSIEWLPDTFGYAASLPQLLRQAEIDYFMTTKLNWNDTNVFPYDLFQWVGIDGTPVLSYLNHGVNESTTVKDIDEHWQSFRQKGVHPQQMLLYGHGDGGGGVTEPMVEYVQHAEWMIGQPKAEFGTAKQFFEHVSQQEPELPVWRGDLYLELHRGTYTTQAWNKRYNRKAEIVYREAEIWERLAMLRLGVSSLAPDDTDDHRADTNENSGSAETQPMPIGNSYVNEQANLHHQHQRTDADSRPNESKHVSSEQPYSVSGQAAARDAEAAAYSVSPLLLHRAEGMDQQPITPALFKQGWLGIMLNQFHDIVPGSAIHEVYRTSDVEYEEILRIGQAALDQALDVWTQAILQNDMNGNLVAGVVKDIGIAAERDAVTERDVVTATDVEAVTDTAAHTETGTEVDTETDTEANTEAGTRTEIPYVVFNSLGWERGDWIEIRGGDELHGLTPFDKHGQALPCDIVVLELAEPEPPPVAAPLTRFNVARPKLPGLVPLQNGSSSQGASSQSVSSSSSDSASVGAHLYHANGSAKQPDQLQKLDPLQTVARSEQSEHLQQPEQSATTTLLANQQPSASKFALRIHVPSIPAFGYTVIWLRAAEPMQVSASVLQEYEHEDDVSSPADIVLGAEVPVVWETPFYTIRFNEQGEIASLYDKEFEREVLKSEHAGNVFGYYHDRPTLWDAWDIDPQFATQSAGRANLLFFQVVMRGVTGDILRFRWEVGGSTITQDIYLYTAHRRIDFRTTVDWQESHKLLKVSFPVDLIAEQATYEIPFGALERTMNNNTSWERAQFEVCGHRWADVSEGDYGVSLLNDCKYGYDIKDGHMRLSLLRAPKWPDHAADIGQHEFTYSLLPHGGNWREAHIVRAAAELNQQVPIRLLAPAAIKESDQASSSATSVHARSLTSSNDDERSINSQHKDTMQTQTAKDANTANIANTASIANTMQATGMANASSFQSSTVAKRSTAIPASVSFGQDANESHSKPAGVSLLHYSSQHVVLDTIKPAEDGDGTIFRLYESSGSRSKIVLTIPATAEHEQGHWLLTNLLEDEQQRLETQDGRLELTFKPYEIKTLKWKGSE